MAALLAGDEDPLANLGYGAARGFYRKIRANLAPDDTGNPAVHHDYVVTRNGVESTFVWIPVLIAYQLIVPANCGAGNTDKPVGYWVGTQPGAGTENVDWAREQFGGFYAGKYEASRADAVPGDPTSGTSGTRALTGSGTRDGWTGGTNLTSHTGTPTGVFDLNGNVWEWTETVGLAQTSGNYVVNYVTLPLTAPGHGYVTALSVDPRLRRLGLAGTTAGSGVAYFGGDLSWKRADTNVKAFRGGSWLDAGQAGLWTVRLYDPRNHSDVHIGFRPALRFRGLPVWPAALFARAGNRAQADTRQLPKRDPPTARLSASAMGLWHYELTLQQRGYLHLCGAMVTAAGGRTPAAAKAW